jgi:CRP-like cAMP-binding protein
MRGGTATARFGGSSSYAETLIREGETPDAMFLLSGGTVEVSRDEGSSGTCWCVRARATVSA